MKESARLDKVISDNTGLSRRDAKIVITKGKVMVNNSVCKQGNLQVKKCDVVTYNDVDYTNEQYVYLIMHKPKGVVSATKDNFDKTVLDVVPDCYFKKGLFPVGRLDKDTTGLLIITNDGDFAHKVTAPSKTVKKTYIATIDTDVTDEIIDGFFSGIQLKDEKLCRPAVVKVIEDKQCSVVITEGMHHQIKRMFGCFGAKVLELHRDAIGELKLPSDIEVGQVREMTEQEKNALFNSGNIAQ